MHRNSDQIDSSQSTVGGKRRRDKTSPLSADKQVKKQQIAVDKNSTEMGEVGQMSISQLKECFRDVLDARLHEVKDDIKQINVKCDVFMEENNKLKEKIKDIENKFIEVNNQLEYVRQQLRKNNIVFRGLKCNEADNYMQIVKTFCVNMLGAREDVTVSRVYAVSSRISTNSKILIAEFPFDEDKVQLLRKSRILNGTQFSIQQDMVPTIRYKHNKLLAIRKQIKLINKNAKINVRMDNMYCNGMRFTWCECKGLIMNGTDGVKNLNELFNYDFTDYIHKLLNEKQKVLSNKKAVSGQFHTQTDNRKQVQQSLAGNSGVSGLAPNISEV